MKLKVNKDSCIILENEIWNVGDYNVHTVEVELSDDFNGLVNKVRYFVGEYCYDMLITNNVAQVPIEATQEEGVIEIGVYGFDIDSDMLVQSTKPIQKYITKGTYTGEPENVEPLTPTDKEQMETAIQANTNAILTKQDILVSGENIKTINNQSILGGGNIDIQGGSGTGNYPDLNNLPLVNNVTLIGNKTSSQLGLQPAGNYATTADIANFITKDVNDLTNYTTTTDMNTALASKQDATDNNLTTTSKTIVGAINEIDSIALGANQALSYANYQTMITVFNSLDDDVYNVGQNIYVVTTEVPDLWISSVESTSSTYTYTTDSAFTTALATDGYVQVGYYKLSALETQKVDLTNYVDLTSIQTITGNKTFNGNIGVTTSIFYGSPRPSSDNSIDLGLLARRWKDFYLAGNLTDGTNSIAVNKIANKDNFVTLTQAEYDALETKDPDTYYFIEEE